MANTIPVYSNTHAVGLDHFAVANITSNVSTNYAHEDMIVLKGISAASLSVNTTESEFRYDDQTEKTSLVSSITLSVTMEFTDFKAISYLQGAIVDDKGIHYLGNKDARKNVAVAFRVKLSDNTANYYKLLNAKINYTNDSYKTAEKSDAVTLEFTATPIALSIEGINPIKLNYNAPVIDETDWADWIKETIIDNATNKPTFTP